MRIWEGPKRGRRRPPIICLMKLIRKKKKLTGSIREGLKGGRRCHPITLSCQPPRILFTGIRFGCKMYAPPGSTLSQTKCGHKHDDWPETTQNLSPLHKTWDCEARGRAVSLGSLTQVPFSIKSLALSARMSPQIIHFWMLDKSPLWGSGRGAPSCNTFFCLMFTVYIYFHSFAFNFLISLYLKWVCVDSI